jgi:hypothetical protein
MRGRRDPAFQLVDMNDIEPPKIAVRTRRSATHSPQRKPSDAAHSVDTNFPSCRHPARLSDLVEPRLDRHAVEGGGRRLQKISSLRRTIA